MDLIRVLMFLLVIYSYNVFAENTIVLQNQKGNKASIRIRLYTDTDGQTKKVIPTFPDGETVKLRRFQNPLEDIQSNLVLEAGISAIIITPTIVTVVFDYPLSYRILNKEGQIEYYELSRWYIKAPSGYPFSQDTIDYFKAVLAKEDRVYMETARDKDFGQRSQREEFVKMAGADLSMLIEDEPPRAFILSKTIDVVADFEHSYQERLIRPVFLEIINVNRSTVSKPIFGYNVNSNFLPSEFGMMKGYEISLEILDFIDMANRASELRRYMYSPTYTNEGGRIIYKKPQILEADIQDQLKNLIGKHSNSVKSCKGYLN